MWKTQPLKLNSYKIDNSTLQANLRELNNMKEELSSTISNYRANENSIKE